MTRKGRKALLSFVRWLRKHFPGTQPVYVRLVEIPPKDGALAYTTTEGDATWIFIEKRQALNAALYWLGHEWAHHLAGVTGKTDRDHGPHWGHAVSRVEQQYLLWLRASKKHKRKKPRQN